MTRIAILSTTTPDADAPMILRLMPGSELDNRPRRVTKTLTLDGGVYVDDRGFFDADRDLVIKTLLTREENARLKRLLARHQTFTLSTDAGFFVGAIGTVTGSGGRRSFRFLATEAGASPEAVLVERPAIIGPSFRYDDYIGPWNPLSFSALPAVPADASRPVSQSGTSSTMWWNNYWWEGPGGSDDPTAWSEEYSRYKEEYEWNVAEDRWDVWYWGRILGYSNPNIADGSFKYFTADPIFIIEPAKALVAPYSFATMSFGQHVNIGGGGRIRASLYVSECSLSDGWERSGNSDDWIWYPYPAWDWDGLQGERYGKYWPRPSEIIAAGDVWVPEIPESGVRHLENEAGDVIDFSELFTEDKIYAVKIVQNPVNPLGEDTATNTIQRDFNRLWFEFWA